MAKIAEKVYVRETGEFSRNACGDGVELMFRFSNGNKVRVRPEDLPENVRRAAMLHGLSQKLGDTYSNAKDEGGDDPVGWAQAQVEGKLEALKAGDWVERGEGGGASRITVLAQAVAEVQRIDPEDAAKALADMDKATKKKVEAHPKVKQVKARIEAERAAERAKKLEDANAEDGEMDLDSLF